MTGPLNETRTGIWVGCSDLEKAIKTQEDESFIKPSTTIFDVDYLGRTHWDPEFNMAVFYVEFTHRAKTGVNGCNAATDGRGYVGTWCGNCIGPKWTTKKKEEALLRGMPLFDDCPDHRVYYIDKIWNHEIKSATKPLIGDIKGAGPLVYPGGSIPGDIVFDSTPLRLKEDK